MSRQAACVVVSTVAIMITAAAFHDATSQSEKVNVVTSEVNDLASFRESLDPIRKMIDEHKYDEAEKRLREKLTQIQSEKGPDSLEAAEVMHLLAYAFWRGPKKTDPEAIELAEHALKIREAVLGPDSLDVADTMTLLGCVRRDRGEFGESAAAFERAVVIKEKVLGPDDPEVAEAILRLCGPVEAIKDFDRLSRFVERATAIFEKSGWPEDSDRLSQLNNLSLLLTERGYYETARPVAERVVAIKEKVFGPDDPRVAISLGNLAYLLRNSGDLQDFIPVWERVLKIFESAYGPKDPHVAATLVNYATSLDIYNAGARQMLERALAIYEVTPGPESEEYAWALTNLAKAELSLGDYDRAKRLYEQAIDVLGRVSLTFSRPDIALAGLGQVHFEAGRLEDAKECLERALAAAEKARGPEHPELAPTLRTLAAVERRFGDLDSAMTHCERAKSIYEKAFGPDHSRVAFGLLCLAGILEASGDPQAARNLCEQAIPRLEKVYGQESLVIGRIMPRFSAMLWASGDTQGALTAALRAERIGREHLRLTARSLPERQGLQYASVRTSGLSLALSNATSAPAPDAAARVLDAVIRSRALVLDEMAERHRAAAAASDPELARLESEFAAARTKLAALTVRGPDERNLELSRQRVERAREAAERAERALAVKSAAFRQEQARSAAGLDQVMSTLPANSVLVSFVRYDRREPTPPSTAALAGESSVSSYAAFVSRAGASPILVPLGDAAAIDELVLRAREAIAAPVTVAPKSSTQLEATYRQAGAALRKAIWDPIAPKIAGAERVFIVPDGALNLVNLGALPVGKTAYVVEKGPVLHYLSAERDLVGADPSPRGEGLLALGDPAFDEAGLFASLARQETTEAEAPPTLIASSHPFRGVRSSCGDFQSLRFERLPDAGREVEEIAAAWTRTEGAHGVTRLEGAAATEGAFKASAPRRRVIHVASHGFFLGGRCASTLAAAERAQADFPTPAIFGDNPLVLSGLALAGANHRDSAAPDEEDGILTAEEIGALDLSGVEWAVLSGCDTGVGEVRVGEGVVGLRRAFEVAGARTVIMSLWPVEDESARAWMKSLYDHRFHQKLGTAESVRHASLDVLRQRRARKLSTHPFFWAGFVAAGGWE